MRSKESHSIRNVAPSLRLNHRFKLMINLKFSQSYPKKSRKNLKDTWHGVPEP
jgi:hypothetical protein